MQVASIRAETNEELLNQEYIRDPSKKISDLIKEAILKFGENIRVVKFVLLVCIMNFMDIVSTFESQATKTIEALKEDLKSIRTGRASPNLVENLIVETYGGQTKLRLLELATIMTEGASSISISPYDPSVIQDIERAILKSPLGLTPSSQGTRIIIRIPSLNTEQREKYIKVVAEKIEEKR